MKIINLMDVKVALKDKRFRDSLPEELQGLVNKYLSNPGCSCNGPLYKKLIKEYGEKLTTYFPGSKLPENEDDSWMVINCHINELEGRLRKLPIGRKQITSSRFEDQVTVIVHDLE